MKIHRFFVADITLKDVLVVDRPELVWQWTRVLRFKVNQQLVLFDGQGKDRTYKVTDIAKKSVTLKLVADNQPLIPAHDTYVFWSLLKKDKNDWVLQKATELGATHFVPLLAERSEKTGFHLDRAHKIVTEALEQCGRSDTVTVVEPIGVEQALDQFAAEIDLYVAEQGQSGELQVQAHRPVGILIGPEGGWSEGEKDLFKARNIRRLALSPFTLRAETAAVTAVVLLAQ